jgi:hypothetical protein
VVGLPALPDSALRPRDPKQPDRDGAAVTAHRAPRNRDGTAWLVANRDRGDFACYWYVGRAGDHLREQGRAATAEDAVAWGRSRTANVRIRTVDGHSQWAGSAPRPDGMSATWTPVAAADQFANALEGAPC